MIRDFPPDPLPQGCPFSFVSKLERNESTKVTKQALLGALRYVTCVAPAKPEDQMSRTIKNWFAFALDEKTTGLWGYHSQGKYNFKITSGGKKDADPLNPDSATEGKDQALLEMWNDSGYGLTHYVNEGDGEAQADAAANKKQSGFYYYSPGARDYSQLFVTDNESSMWGFTRNTWQYKLAAEANSTIFQIWKGPDGTDEDPPRGYAKMYAYDEAGGFSCSKSDKISSTLEPSSLYCIDKSSKDLQGTYYAGGCNTWVDGQYTQTDGCVISCYQEGGIDAKFYAGGATMTTGGGYTQVDGSTISCDGNGASAKFYAGGATMTTGGGYTQVDGSTIECAGNGASAKYYAGGAVITAGSGAQVDLTPKGSAYCYIQQVKVCVDGKEKSAWVLMSDPA
jgi:hypothetical protein